MMDWGDKQHQQHHQEELMNGVNSNSNNGNGNGNGNGGMFVKVMTDEQMEVLRKQIAAYATICEQLVEMHKSLTSHPDLSGLPFLYFVSRLSAISKYSKKNCFLLFLFVLQ